ncbi:MAG: protein phosphatase 2C domain-containing protein [Bacilli bacterium]|nr:protein phosphatase 2C domain-containing protein [Bacilli bacterium]
MTKEEYEEELKRIQKARFSKEDKERLIRELTNAYDAENAEKQKEELDKMLSRAIIGTMDNHPHDYALGSGMSVAIFKLYNEHLSNIEAAELLCNYISAKSTRFNVSLREEVLKYYKENPDKNIILDILELLMKNTSEKEKLVDIRYTVSGIIRYNEKLKRRSKDAFEQVLIIYPEYFINNTNYKYFDFLFSIFKDKINIEKLFEGIKKEGNDIEIEDITKTCYSVLSNIDGFVLRDSYSGTLLDGKIDLATDRGYRSSTDYPQQDAVGSLVYDDNHFINIVADGVGGTDKGHAASLEFVHEVLSWYRKLPTETLDDIDKMSFYLNNEIKAVNRKIFDKYKGDAQTTYVIALTVGDKTIISNVGDSTAYTYDEETDTLIELTTLDSESYGMSYDEARYNPDNNIVTEDIGYSYKLTPHVNIIDNNGQTIILSSDGITDLASEETFKSYFRNNASASEMVHNAVYNPDEAPYKMEDNVSAIKIELPNGSVKRRGL